MSTSSRLLSLLSLLQTRRDWPGTLLATRLKISDRTVRRDIDRLREMGYSIQTTMGPHGGYRLDAGSELPPLLFDDEQALAVAIALQTAPAMGAGIEEAAIRALGTIRQIIPSRLRHRLNALKVTAIGPSADGVPRNISLDILVVLANTIRDRETLRFDYAHVGATITVDPGPAPPRRVEPHHLFTARGRWYLMGWDLGRDDWRLFRVDRIQPRTPPGPRFTPRTLPGGDLRDFVSARFKGSSASQWPCTGTVILHLPADRVLPFAGDGTVTAISGHTCSLEAGAWSWVALAASIGRFDAPMEVVGPPELASAFAILAERFATTGQSAPA